MEKPGDKAAAEDYLFIAKAERVLNECTPENDWRLRLESEYNAHIDECVGWGDYTYEQGELYKLEYHRGLYGEG